MEHGHFTNFWWNKVLFHILVEHGHFSNFCETRSFFKIFISNCQDFHLYLMKSLCILLNTAPLKASSFNPKGNHRLLLGIWFCKLSLYDKTFFVKNSIKTRQELTRTNSVHSTEMTSIALTVLEVRCKNLVTWKFSQNKLLGIHLQQILKVLTSEKNKRGLFPVAPLPHLQSRLRDFIIKEQ